MHGGTKPLPSDHALEPYLTPSQGQRHAQGLLVFYTPDRLQIPTALHFTTNFRHLTLNLASPAKQHSHLLLRSTRVTLVVSLTHTDTLLFSLPLSLSLLPSLSPSLDV